MTSVYVYFWSSEIIICLILKLIIPFLPIKMIRYSKCEIVDSFVSCFLFLSVSSTVCSDRKNIFTIKDNVRRTLTRMPYPDLDLRLCAGGASYPHLIHRYVLCSC